MSTPLLDFAPNRTAAPAGCHEGPQVNTTGLPLITIVGAPNVGKSVLFNTLTGVYVTVSNYPGTTVEIARGQARLGDQEAGVIDTPGMYGLLPLTEEERVARRILLQERPDLVIHVIDAKNLERMLPMTLQLLEAGLPLILVLNLMDEADRLGIEIDVAGLEAALGAPVVATALARGRGVTQLKATITAVLNDSPARRPLSPVGPVIQYQPPLETALDQIGQRLNGHGPNQLSKRALGLLLLQNDAEVAAMVQAQDDALPNAALQEIAQAAQANFEQPLTYLIARRHQTAARRMLQPVLTLPPNRVSGLAERLSAATINPLTGIPIMLAVLFVLYEFVGVFGAQTLVGFLEETIFEAYINPWIDAWLVWLIPWPVLRDLFGGEYGILTLGFRYAIALMLPIVGTFFLLFSVIEDSGYLPRLALLIDRVFKKIGLNGRAVIPMVLGFGCDTMATIVTRTLETKRERLISTLLLALAIPCSAQLGVMLGLLAGQPALLATWLGVVGGVFLLVGFLAAQLLPGERPSFYMELPPLRLPTLGNVLVKTYTRMEWYFREVFPIFILASILIWAGQLTGLFELLLAALTPAMGWLGLPDEAAIAFLFGFFRRDFGAAGLFDLRQAMTGPQLLVAATTITLFVPCIAQFAVMLKERGWQTALAISVFIVPFAFLVGGALHTLLRLLGVA